MPGNWLPAKRPTSVDSLRRRPLVGIQELLSLVQACWSVAKVQNARGSMWM